MDILASWKQQYIMFGLSKKSRMGDVTKKDAFVSVQQVN